jgi:hypothetical protein
MPGPPGPPLPTTQTSPNIAPDLEPSDKMPGHEASRTADSIRARIAEFMVGVSCADVRPSVDAEGQVTVDGFVANQADAERVADALRKMSKPVTNRVSVLPAPFCNVQAVLDRFTTTAKVDELRLTPNHPDLVYQENDYLTLKVSVAQPVAGYLYVDGFNAEDVVIHLLPAEAHRDNQISARGAVTLGNERQDRFPKGVYQIKPPLGDIMIVALWSATPLFDNLQQQQGPVEVYLDALRHQLEQLPDNRAVSSVLFLKAVPP